MNHIFQPYLRKSVLFFFYDNLIYSKDWDSHLLHLEEVFQVLQEQQLYAKLSKCSFGHTEIEYLGHIITVAGVSTNPKKVQAMLKWPVLVSVKELRSFLGLTAYYRRFVRGYGIISKPLTDLLKKRLFSVE